MCNKRATQIKFSKFYKTNMKITKKKEEEEGQSELEIINNFSNKEKTITLVH